MYTIYCTALYHIVSCYIVITPTVFSIFYFTIHTILSSSSTPTNMHPLPPPPSNHV